MHICAILFLFLASSHLIGLLVHVLFDPCHYCFLVPGPYHFALGCCIWYRCLPAAASRFLRIIQSRIHAAPRRAAAPLPKPNLLLRRRSRSRPARHLLWRRGGRAWGIQDYELVEPTSKAGQVMGSFCLTTDGIDLTESIYVSRGLSHTLKSYILTSLGGRDVNRATASGQDPILLFS